MYFVCYVKKISYVFDLATRYLVLVFFQNDTVFIDGGAIKFLNCINDALINGEFVKEREWW
jgi:hypothetical protein